MGWTFYLTLERGEVTEHQAGFLFLFRVYWSRAPFRDEWSVKNTHEMEWPDRKSPNTPRPRFHRSAKIVLLPIKSRSPHGIVVSAAGEYFSHRLTTALRGERTEKILSATQQKKLLHRIRVSVSRNRRGRSDGSISVQRRIGSLQVPQAATPPPVNGHPGRRPVGRYRRQRRSFSHSGDSQSISTSKPSSDSAFIRVLSWGRWLLSIWIFF